MNGLRLALAQINPVVGDLEGNAHKIIDYLKQARQQKADIVAFPELAVTGYPPEDLVLKPHFIQDNIRALQRIIDHSQGITAIIGFVDITKSGHIYNAAAVVHDRKLVDVYHKIFLPNYGVFDEFRYFSAGKRFPVYSFNKIKFGINICEDIWYKEGPAQVQARAGAEIIININASPFEISKPVLREQILHERSRDNAVMIAYLNTVGGQDELVFDGFSMVYDHEGMLTARASQFEEEMMLVELDMDGVRRFRKKHGFKKQAPEQCKTHRVSIPVGAAAARKPLKAPCIKPLLRTEEEAYRALVLGTRDYITKNGFNGGVIGLSGGIDSALVAVIAADAIGPENVKVVFMPSEFTSVESREDAEQLAANLGLTLSEIAIGPLMKSYAHALEKLFRGIQKDTTEENLQARIRGNLLMALSNKFGWLVLTTGNKSEMSVGYATLYGDMAGGFAVIKDVPKTLVYEICKWKNTVSGVPVIPERMLWKEPTAELKANQKDRDSLPPYEDLDPMLKAYIEDEMSLDEIVNLGNAPEAVKRVIRMVDRSEYKRRQAPPGVKITSRAFGRDWRFPITNRYRSY